MKVGFIGLGNVGAKLSGSLLRNGVDLTIRDLDKSLAEPFLAKGAHWAGSPKGNDRGVRRRHHLPAVPRSLRRRAGG